MKGHTAGGWTTVKEAACMEKGEENQSCTVCGAILSTRPIAAKGHSFGVWTIVSGATVLQAECQERSCAVCGEKETKTVGEKLKATMKLSATKLELLPKETATVKVTGLASGDSVAFWKSSNTSIAKVNKNGKIIAQSKAGKATVTVTLKSGLNKKITVTVKKTVATTKITGLSKKMTVKKGKTYTLKPKLIPSNSTDKITYKSSNTKVAKVSAKGVITSVAGGTAEITVKSGKKSVIVTITVPKTATKKITGVPSSKTMKKGKTYILKPRLTPANSDEKVTYKSSNTKVAKVSAKGVITAKAKGTARITVKSGKKTVICKVTVK